MCQVKRNDFALERLKRIKHPRRRHQYIKIDKPFHLHIDEQIVSILKYTIFKNIL